MQNHSTSRRTFLKSTAAVSAITTMSTLGAPMILAADKAPAKNAIVGDGEYKYECLHDWVKAPESASFGNATHGVAVGKDGLIYLTHNRGKPGSVFIFDPKGKFIRAMGDFHVIGGQSRGHGIDIREEGGEEFLYLSASDSSLDFLKCNLKGDIVWRKGKPDLIKDTGVYKVKSGYRPTNISFSPDGGFFLGDGYGSSYIMQYDKDGKFLRNIGGAGTTDGKFRTPHGQWLDERDGTPKLVVADRANKRLQWFDMNGKHLKTLGGFLFPADIDIQGDIMLVPDLHCRITLLDKDNKVLTHLGEDPEWRKACLKPGYPLRTGRPKWKPGKFIHPHDAAFTKNGDIICAEWVSTGRVTYLRKVDA